MSPLDKLLATSASAVCMSLSASVIFVGSFPVLLGSVSRDLAWDQAVFPQILTAIFLVSAMLMPLTGRLYDRFDPRWPVSAGLVLGGAGFLLVSRLEAANVMFWTAALCLGAGAALCGPHAFSGIIASWHERHRSMALCVTLSVVPMCGQAFVARVAELSIQRIGWRETCQMMAFLVIAPGLVACMVGLKRNPANWAASLPGRRVGRYGVAHLLHQKRFWLVSGACCLAVGSLMGLAMHLVNWLHAREIAPAPAARILSVLFVSGAPGALLIGYVADHHMKIRALPIFYVLPLAGLALMAASPLPALLYPGAALLGLGMGATTAIIPFLATRHFGASMLAESLGTVLAATMVAIGLTPYGIGLLVDLTGSYDLPLILLAICITASALCVTFLERLPEKESPCGADLAFPGPV